MAGTDYKFRHGRLSFYRQYQQIHFIHWRDLSVCSTISTSDRLPGAAYFAVNGCRPLSNAMSQPCSFTSPSSPFFSQFLLVRTAQYLPHDHDSGGLPRTGVRQKAESKTAMDWEMSSSLMQESRNSSSVTTPSLFRSIFWRRRRRRKKEQYEYLFCRGSALFRQVNKQLLCGRRPRYW